MSEFSNREKLAELGIVKGSKVAYNLFLKEIDKRLNRCSLFFQPTGLQLEPTTRCNLKCKFCISSGWDRRGKDMNIAEFKKIIDQFPYLVSLLLQGVGEPLLCKDYFKMINYCKKNRIIVGAATNGTLLNTKNINRLIESKIDHIEISIDGSNAETHEKSKIGSNFNQIIDNIKQFLSMRGNLKTPKIKFIFTASDENIHELPSVLDLAKKIGVDGVTANSVHSWGHMQHYANIKEAALQNNYINSKKILKVAMIKSNEINVPLTWCGSGDGSWLYTDVNRTHDDPKKCQYIFRSCFITVDGYVKPCPISPDPEYNNMGNVLDEEFKDIWNNEKYVLMRKNFIKGNLPDTCFTCTIPHCGR